MRKLIIFLCVVAITSCASNPNQREQDGFPRVSEGMNKGQVLQLMGNPVSEQKFGNETHASWFEHLIVFENGKVVNTVKKLQTGSTFMEASSMATSIPVKKRIIIRPSVPGVSNTNIEFVKISESVGRALAKRGYKVVNDVSQADSFAFLNYRVSDATRNSYQVSVPIYQVDYIESETPANNTTTHTVKGTYGQPIGTVESQTTYQKKPGQFVRKYMGERTTTEINVNVTQFLLVELFEKPTTNDKLKLQWKVQLTSNGPTDDFIGQLPAFALALSNFAETNSKNKNEAYIYKNDPRLDQF